MAELIDALGRAPWYVIVLLIACLAVLIAIAVPIIRLLMKKIEAMNKVTGPGGVVVDLSGGAIPGTGVIATVKISNKTYKLILDAIESTLSDFVSTRDRIRDTSQTEYQTKREKCIKQAIDSIRLLWMTKTNEKDDADLEMSDNFLKLFLEVEFGTTLRDELVGVYKNPRLSTFSEIEESDELKRIIDSCATKMILTIRKYAKMIDGETLKNVINSSNVQIRDTIYDAIKFFVKLSRKEQEDILETNKQRIKLLESKLMTILELDDNKED
jgi:hypothetical protein